MARLADHDKMGHESPRAVAEEASMGTDIGDGSADAEGSFSISAGTGSGGTVQSTKEDVYGNPSPVVSDATATTAVPSQAAPKPYAPHVVSATAIANRAASVRSTAQRPARKVVSAGMTHILANEQKAMAKAKAKKFNLRSLLLTVGGGAIGFLVGGPVGAGIGVAVGGSADYVRAHKKGA